MALDENEGGLLKEVGLISGPKPHQTSTRDEPQNLRSYKERRDHRTAMKNPSSDTEIEQVNGLALISP